MKHCMLIELFRSTQPTSTLSKQLKKPNHCGIVLAEVRELNHQYCYHSYLINSKLNFVCTFERKNGSVKMWGEEGTCHSYANTSKSKYGGWGHSSKMQYVVVTKDFSDTPEAKVHPKCLFNIRSHKFYPLNKLLQPNLPPNRYHKYYRILKKEPFSLIIA